MFNALGHILRVQPRTAEQTDTRQELQHHDPEYQRRQKERKQEKPEDPNFQDSILSVEALQVFLENYLKTAYDRRKASEPFDGEDRRKKPEAKNIEDVQQELNLRDDKRQQSAKAARAAYAYQSAQHVKNKEQILLETTDQASGPAMDISDADITTINELLEKIKVLNQHKIEYLQIERAATFLKSLHNAIDSAIQAAQG